MVDLVTAPHDRVMTEHAPPTVDQSATAGATGPEAPAGQHGPQLPPSPKPAKLLRSRSDRKVAGVAGGLGQYTGIDPLIFRIALVVLAVFGGSGLVLYGLGWLFIPAEGQAESEAERLVRGRGTLRVIAAGALAVLGLLVFGQVFASGPGPGLAGVVVLAVIGVAAYLVLRSDHPKPPAAGWVAGSPGFLSGAPAGSGTYGQTPGTAYTPAAGGPSSATEPPSAATAPAYGDPTAPLPPYYPPPPQGPLMAEPPIPPPPRPRRARSLLGRLTLSATLLVVGVLLAIRAADSDPAPVTVVPAAALATVGIGLLVGAFYGRSRWLILLGVVLAIATGVAAASEEVGDRGIGVRTWAPQSVLEVLPEYRLGIGEATLDLSGVSVPAGERLVVEAAVDVGELIVLLPPDAAVDIETHTESGGSVRGSTEFWTERRINDGYDRYQRPGDASAGRIELDLTVGLGSLTIHDIAFDDEEVLDETP